MARDKAVIVGGGVIGLSSAVCLATAGCDVVLIEQDQLASGSSSRSVGVYTRQYADPFEIAMRMVSFQAFEGLERDRGLHLRRIGYLRLAHDEGTLEEFAAAIDIQRELGLEDGELLRRAGVEDLVPAMRTDDIAGGLFGKSDGYLDGHQLCMTFADIAAELGVEIRTRTQLIEAETTNGGGHQLTTNRGTIEADIVVNAAGSWAQRVGDTLAAPVTIISQRHEACVIGLSPAPSYVIPEVMDYVLGSGEVGLYFRQERPGALVAGLHTNEVVPGENENPDNYFEGVGSEFELELAERLLDRLPGLEMGIQSGWSGLYPMSLDSQIVVGPDARDPSIISACALGGLGVHLSPAVGRMVAEYATRGRVEFLDGTERLSPERFRDDAGAAKNPDHDQGIGSAQSAQA